MLRVGDPCGFNEVAGCFLTGKIVGSAASESKRVALPDRCSRQNAVEKFASGGRRRMSQGTQASCSIQQLLWQRLTASLIFIGFPLMLLVLTLLFRLTEADLMICHWFYGEGHEAWIFADWSVCIFLYYFGPMPGLAMGLGGLLVAMLSRWHGLLRPWANSGLFLCLLLALGPGVLVNGVFKPNWYRPRPKQVSDFGGKQAFVYVWDIAPQTASRSFPSGHASMGFYLMAPAFLLYRRRPQLALFFLALGTTAGLSIGVARLAQGGHFPSDILWSGGMVYAAGLILRGVFQLVRQWQRRGRLLFSSSASNRNSHLAKSESAEVRLSLTEQDETERTEIAPLFAYRTKRRRAA
jgi:lipid A 4'-phosphatase